MNHYCLLGLSLRSRIVLPLIRETVDQRSSNPVDLHLGSWPKEASTTDRAWVLLVGAEEDRDQPETGMVRLERREDGALRHSYADGTTFLVDAEGRTVHATWRERTTLADVMVYLLGPILGAVLHQRRILALHASAIDVDNRAVALLGTAGAGKSTTAAAFAKRGLPVLTDDIATLGSLDDDGPLRVQVDKPVLRLWPDACARVFGNADALPQLAPPWEKRYLDLTRAGFRVASTPRPLEVVYLLDRSEPGARTLRFQPLEGHRALMTLITHTYALPLLDEAMRAAELSYLAAYLPALCVRRVSIPDTTGPELVCAAILGDVYALRRHGRPTS